MKRDTKKIALTIAGSDSGGGAGIQADLKTFASFGVHGTSAITCLTAQNPREVTAVHPVPPGFLQAQLEAISAELPPDAAKTGMLYSERLIEVVAEFITSHGNSIPLVVDPVMVSTSGHELLKPAARKKLISKLFPKAVLVTPNLDEAKSLLGRQITDVEGLRSAAKEFFERWGAAVLMKGGHLPAMKEAVDLYYDGKEELLFVSPFIGRISTHGTGCTFAAAIAASLAQGKDCVTAIKLGKSYITEAIVQSYRAGKHDVLNHQPA